MTGWYDHIHQTPWGPMANALGPTLATHYHLTPLGPTAIASNITPTGHAHASAVGLLTATTSEVVLSQLVFPSTLPGIKINLSREQFVDVNIDKAPPGNEFRSTYYDSPRYRYRVTFEFLRSAAAYAELQTVFNFATIHMGRWDSFLLVDPEDCSVSAMPFGTGDGSTKAFQLQRTLGSTGTPTFWPQLGSGYEPITEVANTAPWPKIYINGVLKTLTTDYTLDSTGKVTFTSAPANGLPLTWSGTYYWRVRFDCDLGADRVVKQIWQTKEIQLVTVK